MRERTDTASAVWHLSQIPKIAHFYWGHDYMPWVRYLTLETFRHHNPDWRMILWTPEVPVHVEGAHVGQHEYRLLPDGGPLPSASPAEHERWSLASEAERERAAAVNITPNCLGRIPGLGVEIIKRDVEKMIGKSLHVDVTSVHVREQVKADYLRLWCLHELGGLSADMDILFYRPMDAVSFNTPENAAITATVSIHQGTFYWGFMLGSRDSPHYRQMWEAAKAVDTTEFRQGHNFYRVAGTLAKDLWGSGLPPGMIDMPFQTVYAPTDRFDLDHAFPESPDRVGIHWHGSSSYGTFVKVTEQNWESLPQILMRSCIERAMRGLGK